MPSLPLPEYGRNVQQMVDFCLTIPDRNERTRCAFAIVRIMSNLFPELLGENGDDHKFWDHINVMSNFELDVDFPCQVITREQLNPRPRKIPYTTSKFNNRHYGKIIRQMIGVVSQMEDGPEKDELISMIAHHMKKLMLTHNREALSDEKILCDLSEFSDGKINLDPSVYLLHDFKEAAAPAQSKKKKKK